MQEQRPHQHRGPPRRCHAVDGSSPALAAHCATEPASSFPAACEPGGAPIGPFSGPQSSRCTAHGHHACQQIRRREPCGIPALSVHGPNPATTHTGPHGDGQVLVPGQVPSYGPKSCQRTAPEPPHSGPRIASTISRSLDDSASRRTSGSAEQVAHTVDFTAALEHACTRLSRARLGER